MRKRRARDVFSRQVRKLRKKRDWTQLELATRARISVSSIRRIEGNRPPDVTLDIVAKIARAFRMTCANLVRDS